jgi:hypothetical protein
VIPRQAASPGGRVDRVDFRGEAVRLARSDVPYRQEELGDDGTSGQLASDSSGRWVAWLWWRWADPEHLLGWMLAAVTGHGQSLSGRL